MTQRVKTIRQIDADMLCCKCYKPAVIVEQKIYYCADCLIKKQKDKDEHISFTQRPKDMC